MNDTYVELLIRKKHSILPVLLRNLLIVAGVLALLAAFLLTGSIVLFLAGAILLGLAYLVNFNKIIEYEYLFLDKHLTIDRIQNQSRRKTMAEYDLTTTELFAPASSGRMAAYQGRNDIKTADYSTGEKDSSPYALIIKVNNQLQRVLLEVNDELFEQIRKVAPRVTFRD